MELQHICRMGTQGDRYLLDAWAEMRRKLSSHSAQVRLYIMGGKHEQGKGSDMGHCRPKEMRQGNGGECLVAWVPVLVRKHEGGMSICTVTYKTVDMFLTCGVFDEYLHIEKSY